MTAINRCGPYIPPEVAELQISAKVDTSQLRLFVSVLNRSREPGFLHNVYQEASTWFNVPPAQPGPTRSAAEIVWLGNDGVLFIQGPEQVDLPPYPTYVPPGARPGTSVVGPGERSDYEISLPLPLVEWSPYHSDMLRVALDHDLLWPDGQRTPACAGPVPVRRIHFRLQATFGNVPFERRDGCPWVVSVSYGGKMGVLAASLELPSAIPLRYWTAGARGAALAVAGYAADLDNPRRDMQVWVPRPGFVMPPGPIRPVAVEKA